MTSDGGLADSQQRAFLNLMLDVNPFDEAGRILNQCTVFSHCDPEDVMVEVVAGRTGDPYATAQFQLKYLRRRFWEMSAEQRLREIQSLETSSFADVRAQGKRLKIVASHLDQLRSLERERYMNAKFFAEFRRVLICGPAEANRIREAQLRYMSPVNNHGYMNATKAIQSSANLIKSRAPEVFQLERAWMNELIVFKPKKELVDESSNAALGWLIIIMVGRIYLDHDLYRSINF